MVSPSIPTVTSCLAYRRFQTDLLVFSWRHFAPKAAITKQVAALVAQSSSDKIIDLCSGSGGPVTVIYDDLKQQSGKELSLLLTDFFPNRDAPLPEGISYWPEPVDARDIDKRLVGVRTLFGCLHHFSPKDARKILRDARYGSKSKGTKAPRWRSTCP